MVQIYHNSLDWESAGEGLMVEGIMKVFPQLCN